MGKLVRVKANAKGQLKLVRSTGALQARLADRAARIRRARKAVLLNGAMASVAALTIVPGIVAARWASQHLRAWRPPGAPLQIRVIVYHDGTVAEKVMRFGRVSRGTTFKELGQKIVQRLPVADGTVRLFLVEQRPMEMWTALRPDARVEELLDLLAEAETEAEAAAAEPTTINAVLVRTVHLMLIPVVTPGSPDWSTGVHRHTLSNATQLFTIATSQFGARRFYRSPGDPPLPSTTVLETLMDEHLNSDGRLQLYFRDSRGLPSDVPPNVDPTGERPIFDEYTDEERRIMAAERRRVQAELAEQKRSRKELETRVLLQTGVGV